MIEGLSMTELEADEDAMISRLTAEKEEYRSELLKQGEARGWEWARDVAAYSDLVAVESLWGSGCVTYSKLAKAIGDEDYLNNVTGLGEEKAWHLEDGLIEGFIKGATMAFRKVKDKLP